MAGDITVNANTEYYLRENRRVYYYLRKIVASPEDYDLNSYFKDGGDCFVSLQTIAGCTPNIFEILLGKLSNYTTNESCFADDCAPAERLKLDYKLDVRSVSKFKPKEREKVSARDPSSYSMKDKECVFAPKIFSNEITEEMKGKAMESYIELVNRVETISNDDQYAETISKLRRARAPGIIANRTYFDFIAYLFYTIRLIEELGGSDEDTPDWNSQEFVLDTFSIHEIKMALNFYGISAMSVVDVNVEYDKKVKVCDNQVWLIILINFIGTVAYQLPVTIVPMYIQAIYSETTTFSGAFQYAFSLAQMFGVVIFHRVSERIGRRPVFILVTLVYALTNVITIFLNTKTIPKIANVDVSRDSDVGYAVCIAQILVRLVQGFFGLVTPMTISMISDVAAPSVRANALGISGGVELGACTIGFSIVSFAISNIPFVKETAGTKENAMILCCAVAACLYFICSLICIFGLKETSAVINAKNAGLKLGIKISKEEETVKPEPFGVVFKKFWKNRNLVLIFLDYFFILGNTQITSATTGAIAQTYLNRHMVELGTYAPLMSVFSCGIATIFILTGLSPMIKKVGEVKSTAIIISLSAIELIYISSNPPLNDYAWGCLGSLLTGSIIIAEACLMTLSAAETTPQNRASISGIMQVSNSLGRVVTPLIWPFWMDHNIRDAVYGNIIMAGGVLFITGFMSGVVETPELENRKKKLDAMKEASNKV